MGKQAEIRKRIKAVREAKGMTQAQVAKILGVSQGRLSQWEKGSRKPVGNAWIALAKWARETHPEEAILFLRQTRLDKLEILSLAEHILRARNFEGKPPILSLVEERMKERVKDAALLAEKGDVILVPRFRETAQGREEIGPRIPLPAEFIPNPGSTFCLIVDRLGTGVVDSPFGLFLVDASFEAAECLKEFVNQVAVVSFKPPPDPERDTPGIYVGRFLVSSGLHRDEAGVKLVHEWEFRSLMATEYSRILRVGSVSAPLSFDVPKISALFRDYSDFPFSAHLRDRPRDLKEYMLVKDKLLSEFRLPVGSKIIGKVIGRLTGHLK